MLITIVSTFILNSKCFYKCKHVCNGYFIKLLVMWVDFDNFTLNIISQMLLLKIRFKISNSIQKNQYQLMQHL